MEMNFEIKKGVLIESLANFFKENYEDAIKNGTIDSGLGKDVDDLFDKISSCTFSRTAVINGLDFFIKIREANEQNNTDLIMYKKINRLHNEFYETLQEKLFNFLINYYLESSNIGEEEEDNKEGVMSNITFFLGKNISDKTWDNYKKYKFSIGLSGKEGSYELRRDTQELSFMLSLTNFYHNKLSYDLDDENPEDTQKKYYKMFCQNIVTLMRIELDYIDEIYKKKYKEDNLEKLKEKVNLDAIKLRFIRSAQRLLKTQELSKEHFMVLEEFKKPEDKIENIDNIVKIKEEVSDSEVSKVFFNLYIDDNICQTFVKNKAWLYEDLNTGINKLLQLKIIISEPEMISIKTQEMDLESAEDINILNIIVEKSIGKKIVSLIKNYIEEIVYENMSNNRNKKYLIENLSEDIREIFLNAKMSKKETSEIKRRKI